MNIKKFKQMANFALALAIVFANIVPAYASIDTSNFGKTYTNSSSNDYKYYYEEYYSSTNLLRMLMNSFNTVSENNIQGGHIVGPIVALDKAFGTYDVLYASDYFRGIPSYVANINDTGNNSWTTAGTYSTLAPTFSLNYFYSLTLLPMYSDLFYTKSGSIFYGGGWETSVVEHIIKDGSSTIFSPNYSGQQPIFQNDGYFSTTFTEISTASVNLVTSANLFDSDFNSASITIGTTPTETIDSITYYEIDADGLLNIKEGDNIIIPNASSLKKINITVADTSYDYLDGWIEPTLINITDASINPTSSVTSSYVTLDSTATFSQFPTITFNSSAPFDEGRGEYHEYNENGNKLIFNMPNLTGYLLTLENGVNIPGHLILPQATFCNVDPSGAWEGGNINGCLIAKDIYLGSAEMHMWAYDGVLEASIDYVTLNISGEKTVDNSNQNITDNYEFKLTYKSFDSSSDHADYNFFEMVGILDSQNGEIIFDTNPLTDEGTYTFTVEEVIPHDYEDWGIIFDRSIYEIIVEVDSSINFTSIKITQTHDENGDEIASPTSDTFTNNFDSLPWSDYITFNNETEPFVLPITGGIGTQIYTITGSILLVSVILITIKSRKNASKGAL